MLLSPTTPDSRFQVKNYRWTDVTGIGLVSFTGAGDPCPQLGYQTWTQRAIPASPMENPVAELRRRSGLTFEQVAQVMGVERRTLHFWEAGRGIRPVHEERLQRILQIIRKVDRGNSAATRELLLDSSAGPMLKDLLAAGSLDQAWDRVARLANTVPASRPLPLSSQTRAARRGLPLAERLDLRNDPVAIPSVGPSRPARVIRVGRK
jgi:DNA-binding XRE family transcriptional regulator